MFYECGLTIGKILHTLYTCKVYDIRWQTMSPELHLPISHVIHFDIISYMKTVWYHPDILIATFRIYKNMKYYKSVVVH